MAIDYSQFAIPKPRPRALDKEADDAERNTLDQKESAKARKRARGQCEVRVVLNSVGRKSVAVRCERPDSQTHHLLGGIGRRNRGESILAHKKLRTCTECH